MCMVCKLRWCLRVCVVVWCVLVCRRARVAICVVCVLAMCFNLFGCLVGVVARLCLTVCV